MKLTIPGLLAMGMLAGPIAAQAAVTFSTDTQTDLVGTFSVTGTSVESTTPSVFDFGLSFCMPVRASRGTTASAGLQCAGSPDDPHVSLPNILAGPRTASSISGATDALAGTGVSGFVFSFSDLRDTGGADGTFSGSFCFSRRPAGCPSFEPAPQAATLDGFYAPVDPSSVATNNARAGQTIPLKFHAETAGGPITDLTAAVLTIAGVACTDVSPAAGMVEESPANTSVALANLGGGDYQYNWKTARSDAGTCKTIMLSLPESYATPTRPMATFRFR